jgi:hypothetical protein
MTDEELLKQLREIDDESEWESFCNSHLYKVAADAIERLTRERDEATLRATVFKRQYRQCCEDHAVMKRERDEARAKALEEAALIAWNFTGADHVAHDVRTGVFPKQSYMGEAIAYKIRALATREGGGNE